jgi:hypothetical protein
MISMGAFKYKTYTLIFLFYFFSNFYLTHAPELAKQNLLNLILLQQTSFDQKLLHILEQNKYMFVKNIFFFNGNT